MIRGFNLGDVSTTIYLPCGKRMSGDPKTVEKYVILHTNRGNCGKCRPMTSKDMNHGDKDTRKANGLVEYKNGGKDSGKTAYAVKDGSVKVGIIE